VKRIVRWLVGLLVVARALRRSKRDGAPEPARERIVAPAPPDRGAENLVVALLLAAAGASVCFVVAYGLGWSTQVLGGTLAVALALVAAALLVVGGRLIATEELSEPYPDERSPEAERDVAQIVRESGEGITRKKLIGGAAGVAGGALGAALVVPAASLGPVFDTSRLNETPWRAGRRLVDEQGRPLGADEIEVGPFYTAFPEGHARSKQIGAPLVLVRLEPERLRLPPDRDGWAPEGILAFSKICTHAGCAVALYRNPKFRPTQPKPALVCPCHYSTFDPADGGSVLFGPAGRPLPQLPLAIGPDRALRAAGGFSTPPGPSWWGVRDA
jgi:ubiquinol-cytochrome c reductase iron-sulfur subunit